MTTTLVFEEVGTGTAHVVAVRRVLVAGFAGRDKAAVQHHIDELAALGVQAPDDTPTLYRLDPDRVSQAAALVVNGANTSGEVEPVVVVADGQLFLTVGSDHTDRDLESVDITVSKAACIRVVGSLCVPIDGIEDWDDIKITSTIDGSVSYQEGTLASLLPLQSLLEHLEKVEDVALADGDVLFLGTVPVKGDIRPSSTFEASMRLPGVSEELSLSYRVIDLSGTGVTPLRKPELEFYPADDVAWTQPHVGVEGMEERILSMDPASGTVSRILRFGPGIDTTSVGVLRHDFWEEVYILSGDLHDFTFGKTFHAGDYACRPPGMPHGPWTSENGCLTFEVRYPAI
jgi:hypothetical protein